jgi:hypothetical protein
MEFEPVVENGREAPKFVLPALIAQRARGGRRVDTAEPLQ